MNHLSVILKIFLLITLFLTLCNGHAKDLCGNGRNGWLTNFTYMGKDPTFNKDYWYAECWDAAIEWGQLYNGGYDYYIIKKKNLTETGQFQQYGYCDLSNTDPTSCDANWYFYNSGYQLDAAFNVKYCSYYTGQSDCTDSSYLTSAGVTDTNRWCIVNPTYRSDFNGTYLYNGCKSGFPYYTRQHSPSQTYYLHWDWCLGRWYVDLDLDTATSMGVCLDQDLGSCNQNLYEYDIGTQSWQLDTTVGVVECGPTKMPTKDPSADPTPQPTLEPTKEPTGPSKAPTSNPSMDPTLRPSNEPTAEPVKVPTELPSAQPSARPSVGPTTMPSVLPSMSPVEGGNQVEIQSTTETPDNGGSGGTGGEGSDSGDSDGSGNDSGDSDSGSNNDDSDDDSGDDSDGGSSGAGSSKTDGGDDGGLSIFDSTESTIYMLAGFGLSLLCCWIICCFWYVRRRRKRLAEGVALANSPDNFQKMASIGSLDSPVSPSSAEAGAGAAVFVGAAGAAGVAGAPAGTGDGEGDGATTTHITQPQMPPAGAAGAAGAGAVPLTTNNNPQANAEAEARLAQQQAQIAHMQHQLRMQQMQQHQLMSQQMQFLNSVNVNMMPQPQVQLGGPVGGPAVAALGGHQNSNGPLLQHMGSNNSLMGAQGIQMQQMQQLRSASASPVGAVMGNNGVGVAGFPNIRPQGGMMPTNPAAAAFTNGIADAFANGGEAEYEDSSGEADEAMYGSNKVTGGAMPPPPAAFN